MKLTDRLPTGMLQFLIFLAVSAIVIPVGINYIAGPEGFGAKLRLHAQMQNAFGLTAGTGVTLRGVDVGTVSSSSLDPDGAGARVDLVLRGGTRVPADSFLQITMASMAGCTNESETPISRRTLATPRPRRCSSSCTAPRRGPRRASIRWPSASAVIPKRWPACCGACCGRPS